MKSIQHFFARSSGTVLLLTLLATATTAWGARLDLPNSPLFLSTSVTPNVFLQIDDSGSMLEEIQTKPHWFAYCYDPKAPAWADGDWDCEADSWERKTDGSWISYTGVGDFYANFGFVFPTRDTLEDAWYRECRRTMGKDEEWIPRIILSCGGSFGAVDNPPYEHDWRILSSDLNVLYYNPKQIYEPWKGPCDTKGTPCANASFEKARSSPFYGSDGYDDVRDLTGFVFEIWTDDKGYSGNVPRRGYDADGAGGPDEAVNVTREPNGEIDLWDTHARVTVEKSRIKVEVISYDPDKEGLNPTIRPLADITNSAVVESMKQNIANWYQYHRRRAMTAKAAIAEVITKRPNLRYGASTINETRIRNPLFIEVPAPDVTDYASHNSSLLEKLLEFQMGQGGTPLRKGLERVGEYFSGNIRGKADPILPEEKGGACQKHFALLFTDGYWNKEDPSVGDSDGDGIPNTLADVAMYYYQKDLSPLENKVPADSIDPATHQHMVTFGAAFGVNGRLTDTDGDGWPNPPLTADGNWGDPTTDNSDMEKIDDLWHAAFNSRGGFFSAATPEGLLKGLNSTMEQITGRSNASAAMVALSSGYLNSDARVYQARFDSGKWTGQLLSYRLLNDPDNMGKLDTTGSGPEGSEWDAAQKIPRHDSRTIVTYDRSSRSGKPFRWSSLNSEQRTALGSKEILRYLRGDDSLEQKNGGLLRSRASKLGDIINSSPLFVGPPAFRYGFDGYASFRENFKDRRSMIYVGANDGMLHAFDAETGVEKFAYVPSALYGKLSRLVNPSYTHNFFVDATPAMGDAYYDGAWHTLLAGGLRSGGKGIYLLDITDPDSFGSETVAASKVLWEFSSKDDASLGYTYAQPTISKMQNGKWAVIFGNGYNSDPGIATLFIAFVDKGSGSWVEGLNFYKLDTGIGWADNPNGLASATPIDIDGDSMVDYIYAGDLFGNLWKFDVSSSDPSKWAVASLGGTGPTPLFQTQMIDGAGNRQPITVRPEVGHTPFSSGIMIYFGTGKFLEMKDVSSTAPQSFYAILDNNVPVTVGALLKQEIEETTNYGSSGQQIRITSNRRMTSEQGWYLDLPADGERQISSPVLRGRRVIFTTMSPSGSTCESGGESWLMVLDAFHGSRLQSSPFDLNKDGSFDRADLVDKRAASGMKIGQIADAPGLATSGDKDFVYLTGDPANEPYALDPGESTGRKSWRQIR
ncbi:MAG TPA: pilus assembly protein [Gammaproteobacteria bacterium]|nr:pilus assembly protein [Gammaproteobacteria bacterium]